METTSTQTKENIIELATLYVGDALCGMDILQIQEINKTMEMTKVPQAPEFVLGILNLRGQIVTIIDLSKKLGLGDTVLSSESRNIVVNSAGGFIGLLVKGIGDVVEVNTTLVERAPANMGGIQGEYFTGVYKTDKTLIGILDINKALSTEE